LLARALTHSSTGGDDNEQLEFLGDRVLGFLIAELLIKKFPQENEGALALKLNTLVRRETCARVAEAAGVDAALILAASEDRSGGRRKAAILGDACEAVIAALYLDGGIDAARTFVTTYWKPLLLEVTGDLRDPKNALQEWAQGRKLGTPNYRVAKREGPRSVRDPIMRRGSPSRSPYLDIRRRKGRGRACALPSRKRRGR
jgi:ribonuclease-3